MALGAVVLLLVIGGCFVIWKLLRTNSDLGTPATSAAGQGGLTGAEASFVKSTTVSTSSSASSILSSPGTSSPTSFPSSLSSSSSPAVPSGNGNSSSSAAVSTGPGIVGKSDAVCGDSGATDTPSKGNGPNGQIKIPNGLHLRSQ
ncbi:hypothetical protein T439DRAFT_164982 [Meredithblackwellia eburnea MCA 4105]